MSENTNNNRIAILVAIIGLMGLVLASTIPLFKDNLVNFFSQNDSASNFDKIIPIKIGDQIWMQNNLNVAHFSSGEPIPEAKNAQDWQSHASKKEACWCYRDYSSTYARFGKFYNFYAVNNVLLKLAPTGWHIPSKNEWQQLITFLNSNGQNKAGARMKNCTGWKDGNGGNNNSNFNAIATGLCGDGGGFIEAGTKEDWWSSSSCCEDRGGFAIELLYNTDTVSINKADNEAGFNVRCVKD